MKDKTWAFLLHGRRVAVYFRWHLCNPLPGLLGWVRGRGWCQDHAEFEFRTRPGGFCYCPDGSTTDLRLYLFGILFWVWAHRGVWRPPCSCDKITWLLFPESHEEEIEDYGAKRLAAEFPGVEPL